VVLLDVTGRDGAGMAHALRAAHPAAPIVALGVDECEPSIVACAEAGVAGYVTREASIRDLLSTIHSAARGELRCSPQIAAALSRRVAALAAERTAGRPYGGLSQRELDVADLLALGLSNREITARLSIELSTVKNHVHNILEKLGVRGRADVAAWARHHDISCRPAYGERTPVETPGTGLPWIC
jgi:DNA-binding NarL/FixJ family response regulator